MLDTVLEGGWIVDGLGNTAFRGDLAVKGGRIARIAPRIPDECSERISLDGMMIAPGFIDVHSHSDFSLFADPDVPYKIAQGITTEITGNCGISGAPVRDGRLTRMQADVCGTLDVDANWHTFHDYLAAVRGRSIGTNIGWLIGYNTVREYVAGVRSSLTSSEKDEILDILSRAMDAGALGMSSGLVYEPGNYATTNELIEACSVIARAGGVYASHTRGLRETLLDGVTEAIEIARGSGVATEVSHLTPQYGGWDLVEPALDSIDRARDSGIDITFDLHLDEIGATTALATLPPHLKAGGIDSLLRRLQDLSMRASIIADIRDFVGPGTSGFLRHERWDILRIDTCPNQPELEGKSLKDIALATGKRPWDAYLDAIVAGRGHVGLMGLYTPIEKIRKVLSHPLSIVATDAIYGSYIPRNWSTMPKLLGRFVREEGLLSIESAVQKVTSRPAARFGLRDRGTLTEGAWADIVVFDPAKVAPTVIDKEVFEGKECVDPRPTGILHVLVNGVFALRDGIPTGKRGGMALLRG
jgi:N-acyl-D-amino-acid deacylase